MDSCPAVAKACFRPLAVLALAVFPVVSSAQTIRGVVVEATGAPVAGVVVLLLDDQTRVFNRDLSDQRGAFQLSAAGPGVFRVRTMRIGFRSITSEPVSLLVGQEVTQRIVLAGLPYQLETIRVAGRHACEVHPDSAAETFAIWEQVRTALTAAQVTAERRTVGASIVSFERALDPGRRHRVLRQSSRILTGLTTRPWRSLSAEDLRGGGYVVEGTDGFTTYYAPDIAVLLSDAFIEDHCFYLRAGAEIGIAFEPTRDRRKRPEIEGTMWLDRRSSELRRMEFRYVNVNRGQETGEAGGSMRFARMKNGAWVITGWEIRMPVLRTRWVAASGISSRARVPETTVDELRVEGGDLTLVTLGLDTLWSRPPLTFAGRVFDSISGGPVAAAHVVLRGTGLQGRSDSLGRFRIPNVLPGEYSVEVTTPALRSLGGVHSFQHFFIDSASAITIRAPNAEQLAQSLCPASADGIIAGVVRARDDSTPPRGVRVVAQWDETSARLKRLGFSEARTDARGHYRICRVPVSTTVTVQAGTDSASAFPVELRITGRLGIADFVLARLIARNATLTGTILSDIDGSPMADVEVALPAISRNAYTNDQGMFRISDIPPGSYELLVRRLGYKQISERVALAPNQTMERRRLLSRIVTLDTVAVTANVALRAFEEHRAVGLGTFFTRADLEKLQGQPISRLMRQTAGAHVYGGQKAYVAGRRKPPSLSGGGVDATSGTKCPTPYEIAVHGLACACYAQVYLDRMLMYKGPQDDLFDINSIPSQAIEAIEWYAGPSQTPAKYSTLNSACGVLVIHTRRYSKDTPRDPQPN